MKIWHKIYFSTCFTLMFYLSFQLVCSFYIHQIDKEWENMGQLPTQFYMLKTNSGYTIDYYGNKDYYCKGKSFRKSLENLMKDLFNGTY